MDDLDSIIEKDAEAIIRFTREYIYHVYVMPALLKGFEEPGERPATRLKVRRKITHTNGAYLNLNKLG